MLTAQSDRYVESLLGPPADQPTIAEDFEWAASLLAWVRQGRPGLLVRVDGRPERLARLTMGLANAPHADGFHARLQRVFQHPSAVRLFAETGLPAQASLLRETVARAVDGVVPRFEPPDDLYVLLLHAELIEADAAWLEGLPDEAIEFWRDLLVPARESLVAAAELVAHRAAAVGLSRDLLRLQPGCRETASPFFHLPARTQAAAERIDDATLRAEWRRALGACHEALRAMRRRLDEQGVSTEVVYRLDLLHAQLERIALLLGIVAGVRPGRELAVELVRGAAEQRSWRAALRSSLERLSRKVVEHTAHTGEHYKADTRGDWWAMAQAGAIGGVLTAGTGAIKLVIAVLGSAPLLLGLGYWLNYSASFLLLHFLGGALASKLPAMSASALADALEREDGTAAEIATIASMARAQTAATLGNIAMVIPASLALDSLFLALSGAPLLSTEKAEHVLAGLHPLLSFTIPFAILTGALLFLASLAGGWAGNWSAFRSLPAAVATRPRIRAALGRERAERLGALIDRHLEAVVGYVALGFLLGFCPVVFKLVGLDADVRHVTLSSATLTFAASERFWSGDLTAVAPVVWGCLGILSIAVLNISVSFLLALRLALRARGVEGRDRRALFRALRTALWRAPGRFLHPRTAPSSAE